MGIVPNLATGVWTLEVKIDATHFEGILLKGKELLWPYLSWAIVL